MTVWREIDHFPKYEVSDTGEVRNALSGRILKKKVNQQGVVGVGMMRQGVQLHRSVALLVACAFLVKPGKNFDTPINLDGDRFNNALENLRWRPRWHAVYYNRQFKEQYETPITKPIRDIATKVVYDNSWVCAIKNGLLEKDVVLSIINRTYSWPTYQEFETL